MNIYGYSELDSLILKYPGIKNGIIVDTNILVAATYELDRYHDVALDMADQLIEKEIPIYCNVNVRAEFLEIHRRILFTEALLDLENQCDKRLLPAELTGKLTSFRAQHERRLKNKPMDPPRKLTDSEIKEFKLLMVKAKTLKSDL